MKHAFRLKTVIACYACYMIGGFLSAFFFETNNRTGTIIAIAVPTVFAMSCLVVLTQQVQSPKKQLPIRPRIVR